MTERDAIATLAADVSMMLQMFAQEVIALDHFSKAGDKLLRLADEATQISREFLEITELQADTED